MKLMQQDTSVGTKEVVILKRGKFEEEMINKYCNPSNKKGLIIILDDWFKKAERSQWKNKEDIKKEPDLNWLEDEDKYMIFDLGELHLEDSQISRYVLLVVCSFSRDNCVIIPKDLLTIEEYRLRYKKTIPI